MQVRTYGTSGPPVVVLHGGPGAPGYMAPVARGIADGFRVLEPWQRPSGGRPLTVHRHVDDLLELLDMRSSDAPPTLVGHSWGAMLALAFAAAHLGRTASLVLIGCGTFDSVSRERLRMNRERRMGGALGSRLEKLAEEFPDPDERLRATGELLVQVDSHELAAHDLEIGACDARAHRETWEDMVRLQEEGVYPAAFAAIAVPVLMLHGAVDPHPGQRIRRGLAPFLPQLEYHEWDRCGHYPWLETRARDEFFVILRRWLVEHT